jgi:membrane protease YdiL (CAAX protease family)
LTLLVSAVVALGVWVFLIEGERSKRASGDAMLSAERLEGLVRGNAFALGFLLLKWGTAAGGLVVLILYLSKRAAIRTGRLPPPLRPAPPVPVLDLVAAGAFVLAYVLTILLVAGAVRWTESRGWLSPGTAGSTNAGIVVMTIGGMPYAAVIVALRRRRPRTPSVRARIAPALQVFLVASFVTVVLAVVGGLVLRFVFGQEPMVQDLVKKAVSEPDPTFLWLLTVYGVLGAPIIEEALFRGLLYPAVRATSGPTIAALSTSILFAAIHSDASAYLPLLGLGLLLAGLFEATDSLLAVTVVHALNNLTSLAPLVSLGSP